MKLAMLELVHLKKALNCKVVCLKYFMKSLCSKAIVVFKCDVIYITKKCR